MMTMLRESANDTMSTVLAMIEGSKTVLDVGCAAGDLARALTLRECAVVGIDVNPQALDVAGAFCTRVILADLDAEPLTEIVARQTFDAIVFTGVLEFLRAPLALLEQSRALVNAGGSIIASVPSRAGAKLTPARFEDDADHGEDQFASPAFTDESIGELFATAGWRIERIVRIALPGAVPDPQAPFVFVVKASAVSDAERYDELANRVRVASLELANVRGQRTAALHALTVLEETLRSRDGELDAMRAHLANAESEMRAAQARYREREQPGRDPSDVLHELAAVRRDFEALRREAVALRAEADAVTERFTQHVAVRTARTRARANALERRIDAVQRGWSWRLKRLIQRRPSPF